MTEPCPIGPETKIGDLLRAYPALEEVLIAQAPPFAKLRNPVLRRTVARVATLEQVAKIGGLSVDDLLSVLRSAAAGTEPGAVHPSCVPAGSAGPAGLAGDQEWPEELESAPIRIRIDADAFLARGEHPLAATMQGVQTLAPGEVLLLSASFLPQPLIDALREKGYGVFRRQLPTGQYEVRVIPRGSTSAS